MQKAIKSLMFVVEKTYPVNNNMFKIELKTLEHKGRNMLKAYQNFFSIVDFELAFVGSVVSYLPFHCLDDFHYLDHFHCLHDLQKNWNLIYILKLA